MLAGGLLEGPRQLMMGGVTCLQYLSVRFNAAREVHQKKKKKIERETDTRHARVRLRTAELPRRTFACAGCGQQRSNEGDSEGLADRGRGGKGGGLGSRWL